MTHAIISSRTLRTSIWYFLPLFHCHKHTNTTSISFIFFDPPTTLLCWLALAFSKDVPRDGVSLSAHFSIHQLLYTDSPPPPSRWSHPCCSAICGMLCLLFALLGMFTAPSLYKKLWRMLWGCYKRQNSSTIPQPIPCSATPWCGLQSSLQQGAVHNNWEHRGGLWWRPSCFKQ